MPLHQAAAAVASQVDRDRLLALELELIRTPSSAFEEHAIADFLAGYLDDIGLEVEMMAVANPRKPGAASRQPVARLAGSGGPSLMLNGHMDPGVEMSGWSVDPYAGIIDEAGWIWGMGAHDDKGGVAAMISAVEAIMRTGTRLEGDLLVCPVVAHKYGGVGTRALLDAGIRADRCINMEHSANTIANVSVGIVMARLRTRAPELFFRFSDEARARYMNPVEQQMEVLRRIGPSLVPIPPGGWLTFDPHPDLPGFPMHTVDTIHKEHYYQPAATSLSSRECEMIFQVRTVPGQTLDSVRADLLRLLDDIKTEHPAFDCELEIPAGGPGDTWFQDPCALPEDDPMVQALAAGHELAAGAAPFIGGLGRIGNVGDGNILAAAGIPSVQYGPGDIRLYREWPTPDERVRLDDLEIAARAVAYATCRLTRIDVSQ